MSLNQSIGGTPAGDIPANESPISQHSPMGRVTFLKLKTQAMYKRLECISADMDSERLQSMDEYALAAIVDSVNELKSNFLAAHTSLEEHDFESIGSDLLTQFDTNLVQLKATLQREIGKRSASQHCSTFKMNSNEFQPIIVNTNRSRLPQLTLPKFSGSYIEWTNFYSMFTSVINKDSDLSNVDKLQHLHSCLSGAALDTIRSLEINEANYKIALDLLIKRFDNKCLIFQVHIREIFGMDKADGTVSKLRALSDKVNSHICALQSLGSKEQIADCIVVQFLTQKLDKVTQAKWEESSSINELPSWESLAAFLEHRCRTLENVEHALQTQAETFGKTGKTVSTHQRKSFVASNSLLGVCAFCGNAEHLNYNCQRFLNLTPNIRQKEVKKLLLCLNCLKKGHQMRDCKSSNCRKCHSKHHTLLHFNRLPSANSNDLPLISNSVQANAMTATLPTQPDISASRSPSDVVLLATAIVLVKNRAGTFVPCRSLLDSGSQIHFVTSRFANQLQLPKSKSFASVSGIGDANFPTDGYSVNLVLKSRTSGYSTNITALVAQTITDNQPGTSVMTDDWNVPSNIQLADPAFNIPQRIDMLIGAGLFFELICVGQIKLAPGLPILQKTRLGWVLSGGWQQTPQLSTFIVSQRSSSGIDNDIQLDKLVRRFWEIEHIHEPITKTSKEDLECEEHFKNNYSRLPSGEYSVRLPIKCSLDSLGDSYLAARRRFENIERKFSRNPNLKAKYSSFMKKYEHLGHMSLFLKE
ncbi:uncharacterized protein LOC125777516 [Bactrocera dorsalis]|uniref:Uncharacterized protein LOC125777516 n=1 Tax=Bactrocera dorsalis TaxID=27457 RepID=A0ABM3JH67_BACDO|nr:uncharacterized protein LOC125777516 [Bactrocera dorsalis]